MTDFKFIPDVIFNSPASDEKPAFYDTNGPVTYGDARHQISLLASILIDSGLERADRVAVIQSNSWSYVRSIFATIHAGLIPAVFHPRSGLSEIPRLMKIATPLGLIADAKILNRLSDVIGPYLAGMRFVGVHADEDLSTDVTGNPQKLDEVDWQEHREPEIRCSDPDDGALIIFTTGTTGPPKGVFLSHRNILSVAEKVVDAFELTANDRSLVAASLSHVSSFTSQMMAYPMAGASCYITRGYLAAPVDVIEFARSHDITSIHGMITSVLMLLRGIEPGDTPFPNLRFISVGGMRVTRNMLDEVIRGFPGVKIYNSYGLTETSPRMTAFRIDEKPEQVDSVGPPWSICEVKVIDAECNFLPPGEVGELVVKSPGCMKGYFDDMEATEAAFIDGWMRTGDLARVDEDGYIHIESRINEMINVAGEKVNPYEVEDAIVALDGVRECVVVKKPDDVMGELPVALVIREEGAEISSAEIQESLRLCLASFKIPGDIRFVDRFPTSANGKPLRILPPE